MSSQVGNHWQKRPLALCLGQNATGVSSPALQLSNQGVIEVAGEESGDVINVPREATLYIGSPCVNAALSAVGAPDSTELVAKWAKSDSKDLPAVLVRGVQGTEQPVVSKARKQSMVTLARKQESQAWSLKDLSWTGARNEPRRKCWASGTSRSSCMEQAAPGTSVPGHTPWLPCTALRGSASIAGSHLWPWESQPQKAHRN